MRLFNNLMVLTVIVFSLLFSKQIYAQSDEQELTIALDKVERGKSDEVRKDLPELVAKYPNNASTLYLQGRLATDGIEAVKFYQGVVDNFPKSEWADDALYRIYQYYYSLGLYRTADLKMQQMKKDYPNSAYLTGKTEEKIPIAEEKKVNLPAKEISPVATESHDTIQATAAQEEFPNKTKQDAAENKEPEANTEERNVFQKSEFTVQAGAYSTSKNAEKQKNYFDDLGYKVEIVNKVRNGRNLFLVWIGNFKTMEEARSIVREIKSKYKIDSMIVERY
ncbi:MAG: SPOR domain-containing protein [Ignavibacteriales bacterium]|nr:SPOR domain-containing protein [Ignavibacteriales bacterium]